VVVVVVEIQFRNLSLMVAVVAVVKEEAPPLAKSELSVQIS